MQKKEKNSYTPSLNKNNSLTYRPTRVKFLTNTLLLMDNNDNMIKVTIKHSFQSAVYLRDYEGPCANLHGHTYQVAVTFSNKSHTTDMVIDFYEAKSIVKSVTDRIDYKHINDIKPFDTINPTTENICQWLYNELNKIIPNNIIIPAITLAENDSFFVTYEPNN